MALQGEAPTYITELLHPDTSSWTLRFSDKALLMVPHTRLKTQGDCAFQTLASKLWNSLSLTFALFTLWPFSKGSLKLICSDRLLVSV
ncbi:hypothetical protein LDENG_00091120 [Lucifuga dentata]|nr:hypothetical protein LDENG_00091120 [Lucifuga dentata]